LTSCFSSDFPTKTIAMASLSLRSILAATGYFISIVSAIAIDPQLVGTWTTKSAKVLTGPVCIWAVTMSIVGSDFVDK
jgi:hypothetical protein